MNDQAACDQLKAVWADQQAQEILLRAALKACAARDPAARMELFSLIEQETRRFAEGTADPDWRRTVTALIESTLDSLRADRDQD